jgi:Leucine-rich repeat (LRR) protein
MMLKQLDVSNNALVGLPGGMLRLENLQELNLAGNKLKELPKVRPCHPRLTRGGAHPRDRRPMAGALLTCNS